MLELLSRYAELFDYINNERCISIRFFYDRGASPRVVYEWNNVSTRPILDRIAIRLHQFLPKKIPNLYYVNPYDPLKLAKHPNVRLSTKPSACVNITGEVVYMKHVASSVYYEEYPMLLGPVVPRPGIKVITSYSNRTPLSKLKHKEDLAYRYNILRTVVRGIVPALHDIDQFVLWYHGVDHNLTSDHAHYELCLISPEYHRVLYCKEFNTIDFLQIMESFNTDKIVRVDEFRKFAPKDFLSEFFYLRNFESAVAKSTYPVEYFVELAKRWKRPKFHSRIMDIADRGARSSFEEPPYEYFVFDSSPKHLGS